MNKKVLYNSLWMMLEKVISIFGLIFVTSFVAKYVGPTIFGEIAYATSLFQIIQVLAQLGSDVLIFKRVSRNERSGIKLINATVMLRGLVYIIASIPVLWYFYEKYDLTSFAYVFSVFLSCLFFSLDVFAIYNDAKLESKKNTMVNMSGLTISLIIRWFIPFLKLNPLFLCIPIVLTSLIPFCVRLIAYRKNFAIKPKFQRHRRKYVNYVLVCGASLVISTLSVAIYPRLGMLILGSMESSKAVGIFSVAATLAGSWAFVCNSLITSSLPSIFREKEETDTIFKTAGLNLVIIFVSLLVILGFYLLGQMILKLLYGDQFSLSYIPLLILCFSTFISLLGTISARIIVKYSGYTFLSKKMICVTILSVALNFIFINMYGIVGAAIATLLTEVVSLTVLNYFFKRGIIFRLHLATLSFWPIFKKLRSKA
ncbi:oligosaccharide flippase family protein [Rouxiella sp. S1S-2]|uniref:oligosaccharide flippase family protein n=1 Tax=Rouxiella sp. S1S-2 TaxID=2653856 RepID=UPI0012655E3C|nr:oligosaccharide flippase family protein [Rouxiella sp. S1S-2]KAB7895200.1 oligosaccharide flippase family protein [Rouxiella sp. S1S-2]